MSDSIDRRQFARLLAAGAAGASLASTATADEPAVAEPPEKEAPAELLLRVLKQQYADERRTESVLAEIRGDIEADLSRSRLLSEYALKNSDEPAVRFSAYRADAGETD